MVLEPVLGFVLWDSNTWLSGGGSVSISVIISAQIFITIIDLTFESFTNLSLLNGALRLIIHPNRL